MRALAAAFAALSALATACDREPLPAPDRRDGRAMIELPRPARDGGTSVEAALARRRSVREFEPAPLTRRQLAQLVWAGQGVTAEWGGRTAPSAGALYPIELYAAVTAVEGLEPGVYRYVPERHALERHVGRDVRARLAAAAFDQPAVHDAPVNVVVGAVVERTAQQYRERAGRYVLLEAGHVAQNIALQAVALDLGLVPIGAFDDEDVAAAVELPAGASALYVLPIGHPSP